MEHCCDTNTNELEVLWSRQTRVLWIVLAVNSGMFVAEAAAGLVAGSAALLADSLDMLGDALVYGVSLVVIGRSQQARAGAATLKGAAMLLFGLGVSAEVAYKLLTRDSERGDHEHDRNHGDRGQQYLPGAVDPPPLGRHQYAVGMDLFAQRPGRKRRRDPGRRGCVSHEHRLAGYHRGPNNHRPLPCLRLPRAAASHR